MTPAPYLARIAEGPPDAATWWLTARDGVRIRMGFWGGGGKGTVVIFPGRTETIEKYGRVAAELLARGYCSVAVDWRGQGLADRLTGDPLVGHVGRFSDYQIDVAAVEEALHVVGVPEPRYLLAHSMGGAIGLRALANGLEVSAACFSAPMWGIEIPIHKRAWGWTASWLAVKLGFEEYLIPGESAGSYVAETPFEGNLLTADPEMLDYMKRQLAAHPELSLGGPSLGWLHEALTETRRFRTAPLPDKPVLTWLGGDENIVDSAAIRALMSRWQGTELETVERARHEVLFEVPKIRNRVFDRTCAFFAAHQGVRGSV